QQLLAGGDVLAAFLEFDARVDVLGVLAEDHHVGELGPLDRARHALEPPDRTQAGVEIELLAERDVEAPDATADRGGQRALDADQVLGERGDGLVGQPVARAVERLLAGQHFLPLDLAVARVGLGDRGIEHADRRRPDVGPGAVALDEGDDRVVGDLQPVRAHRDLLGHLLLLRAGGIPRRASGPTGPRGPKAGRADRSRAHEHVRAYRSRAQSRGRTLTRLGSGSGSGRTLTFSLTLGGSGSGPSLTLSGSGPGSG